MHVRPTFVPALVLAGCGTSGSSGATDAGATDVGAGAPPCPYQIVDAGRRSARPTRRMRASILTRARAATANASTKQMAA